MVLRDHLVVPGGQTEEVACCVDVRVRQSVDVDCVLVRLRNDRVNQNYVDSVVPTDDALGRAEHVIEHFSACLAGDIF